MFGTPDITEYLKQERERRAEDTLARWRRELDRIAFRECRRMLQEILDSRVFVADVA